MPLIALEITFALTVVGWGVWELVSLRRDRLSRRASGASTAAGGALPASGSDLSPGDAAPPP